MQTLPANGPTQARDALLGRSLLTTCVAGCTAATILASPVLQADDSSVEQPVLQQVIVTGSRIERSDTDTPSPVQVITSQQIANSGLTSISDVLHALTSNGQGNLNQSFNGAFAAGASGISLRGLTVDATLVLIDGHRMANYPISDDGERSFVDVGNLPESVIDRVEVLKDGASAVYGSDAIAGVVNIILKKTFVGSDVTADAGTSYKGDGTTEHFSATYGFGDLVGDGHNTYVNFEFRHQQAIGLESRPRYSNFDYYDQNPPSVNAPVAYGVVQPGSAFPFTNTLQGMVGQYDPTNPGTPLSYQSLSACPNPTAGSANVLGGCAYNIAAYDQVQPQTTNYNVLLRHSIDFGGGWSAVVTASMFQSKAEQLYSPSTANNYWPALNGGVNTTDPTEQPILLPVGNVNNPYPANPAWLAYTFGDVGPTLTFTNTRMFRFVADLRDEVAGWQLDSSIGVMRGLTRLTYDNYVTLSGLDTVLANNTYHLGASSYLNSPSVYKTLAPTTDQVAGSDLQYVEIGATRSLLNLPGGPLGFAIGIGARHDGQDVPGQPGTLSGDVLDTGTTFIHGTDNNENAYLELSAPLLKSLPLVHYLELDAAGRFDNYGGVGSDTTPKLGLQWRPIEQVMFRGTYSQGFRAPGPGERGNSGVTFFSTAPTDPARCPYTNLPNDCGSGSASSLTLSNPALKPEKSRNYTFGVVLEPLRQVRASVDWWEIRRSGEIESDFADGVDIRGPVQAAYPTLPGPIIAITSPYENIGLDEPKGLDYDLQSSLDVGKAGTLELDVDYSHLISQEFCQFGPSTCVEVAGTHGPTGISGDTGTPRNRIQATLSDAIGPAELGFTLNYVSGMTDVDPTLGPTCLDSWYTACHTASFTDIDLFAHYQVTKQLLVNLHVLNLFNTAAPFDPQAAYNQSNYNNAFAQQGAIGRFFELGLKYSR
jgi:iron complex outermembrane receptor protein